MDEAFETYFDSPIGRLEIVGGSSGIRAVSFADGGRRTACGPRPRKETHPSLTACYSQLEEYFKGERRVFELELDLRGTDFQMSVWEALLGIPFGLRATYKDIAGMVGNERATRAVGGANHRNPVTIIVPCHRVIGQDGRLTGYGGGLWRKEWLLAHEKRFRKDSF